jgi:hypothetical protein
MAEKACRAPSGLRKNLHSRTPGGARTSLCPGLACDGPLALSHQAQTGHRCQGRCCFERSPVAMHRELSKGLIETSRWDWLTLPLIGCAPAAIDQFQTLPFRSIEGSPLLQAKGLTQASPGQSEVRAPPRVHAHPKGQAPTGRDKNYHPRSGSFPDVHSVDLHPMLRAGRPQAPRNETFQECSSRAAMESPAASILDRAE